MMTNKNAISEETNNEVISALRKLHESLNKAFDESLMATHHDKEVVGMINKCFDAFRKMDIMYDNIYDLTESKTNN